jgi:hypothetical protein
MVRMSMHMLLYGSDAPKMGRTACPSLALKGSDLALSKAK